MGAVRRGGDERAANAFLMTGAEDRRLHKRAAEVGREPPRENAAQAERESLRRLLTACLDSHALLTLEPGKVLSETRRLLVRALPGCEVSVLSMEQLGEPALTPGAGEANDLLDAATQRLQTVRRTAGRGELVAVPLVVAPECADPVSRPAVLGAVLLRTPAPLTDETLDVVRLISERAALALEHATVHEVQALFAGRVRQLLVASDPPEVEGLKIGVVFHSSVRGAEIGGDFCDFTSFSPGHVLVAVGDVAGKGIEAAGETVVVKHALRALVRASRWPTFPGDVLRDLHNALQDQLEPPRFATVALALFDSARGSMLVSSAGHPPPLVIRRAGVERPMLLTAPAIALTESSELEPYPMERIEVAPGETVVLFSDGLAELRDAEGRYYDDVRLEAALDELRETAPSELVRRLLADAASFSARPPHDDITIVAVRFT